MPFYWAIALLNRNIHSDPDQPLRTSMKTNPIAENVFGTLGAICWSIQLIPQIIINYRRQNATGLQPLMMLLLSCAGVPLGIYNISENFNIALRIQPQILTTLSLITLGQCLYYEKKWSTYKCVMTLIPLALLLGGIEVGGVWGLKKPIREGIEWPAILMASLSAAFLCAGVLRHYWDIYVFRTVRGISFIFVGLDAAGDLFSLLSLFFTTELNVLGIVIYSSELALWTGVFILGICFNLKEWIHAKRGSGQQERDIPIELPTSRQPSIMSTSSMSSAVSVFSTSGASVASIRRVGEI